MISTNIFCDFINSSPDLVGNFKTNDIEIFIADTQRRRMEPSLLGKLKLLLSWFFSSSFSDLAMHGSAKYNVIIKMERNLIQKVVSSQKHRLNRTNLLLKIAQLMQHLLYRKIGYKHLFTLPSDGGVCGEVVKRRNEYFLVLHSNDKRRLCSRGGELIAV